MAGEICTDGRFEIIEKAKQDLIEGTNIETSPDEMKVLDTFLFRCWQMGWLKEYDTNKTDEIRLEDALKSDVWKIVWAGEPSRPIKVEMTYNHLMQIDNSLKDMPLDEEVQ